MTRLGLSRMKNATAPSLAQCQSGVSAVEFAFIAPVFLMFLLAVFDIGFGMYTRAVLQGAVQDGARSASLENRDWDSIRLQVNEQVRRVIPASNPQTDITFNIDPTIYATYGDIVMPEDLDERNGNNNGDWDAPGECFVDRNNNRQFDLDVGVRGPGGAQDVVAIRAELSYPRAFPLWRMLGQPQTAQMEASTFLRNQPFSAQMQRVGVRICR